MLGDDGSGLELGSESVGDSDTVSRTGLISLSPSAYNNLMYVSKETFLRSYEASQKEWKQQAR